MSTNHVHFEADHQLDGRNSDERSLSSTEAAKTQGAEAMREFMSADNDRMRVCMKDLAKHKFEQGICEPRLDRELYLEAYVRDLLGEWTLRLEERGSQKAFLIRQKLKDVVGSLL